MPLDEKQLELDPVIEVYKQGVDMTLIRENLQRSVDERFERLMELQRFAEELQLASAKSTVSKP